MSVQLTISGDFCITPEYLSKKLVSGEASAFFAAQDVNIVNLECPVNNGGAENKILKYGPHLQTKEAIFDHLLQAHVSVVTLANNHVLDYGAQALYSTMEACNKNNIAFVGAGKNLTEAARHLVIEKKGIRIAVVNFCENESSIAAETTAGASPLDIIDNLAQIRAARAAADFVLVIVHGGNEHYHLPSPRVVKQLRFFAENGADVVASHHTHCISGYEIHKGVPVFYGLGNMLFTKASTQPGWFTGFTLQLLLQKGQRPNWQLIPTTQHKENFELGILQGEQSRQVLQEAEKYSAIIADENQLKASWAAFVKEREFQYLYSFSAMNAIPGRYLRSALKRLGLVNHLFPKKYLLPIINYMNCEAHLEVSRDVLNNKLRKK